MKRPSPAPYKRISAELLDGDSLDLLHPPRPQQAAQQQEHVVPQQEVQ